MKKNSAFIFVLAAALIFAASCGKNSSKQKTTDLSSYPIETDVELTYWLALDETLASVVSNFSETRLAQAMREQTGVNVKYIHPPIGQEDEMFNLMLASNDLPDIIESMVSSVFNGSDSKLRNKMVLPLNDLMKDYAPALSGYLEQHPDIDREVKLDDGTYICFPFIRGDKSLLVSAGPIVRQDWLDELGLDTPKTIADWENVLTAFKEKKGALAPFSCVYRSSLMTFVGSNYSPYVSDGVVKLAPFEPEFKGALEILHRWYENGLLDPNYTLTDQAMLDSNILNGLTGATYASGGSGLGRWLALSNNPDFRLAGVATPLDQHGEINKAAPIQSYFWGYGAFISTSCKYPELAVKYMDYNYTESGTMLNNFGIEGESYKMVDGFPTYTDVIMHNSSGLSVSAAMANYMHSSYRGTFVQDARYIVQYYSRDEQKQALREWEKNVDAALSVRMPSLSLLSDETAEFSEIYDALSEYIDNAVDEFILGIRPISDYDTFIDELKGMGAERMIQIQQNAYNRYLKRK